jgi:thioredoxin 1
MSACCIGGVCIPYSVILPLLAILAKYLVAPLVRAGILPEKVAKWLGVTVVNGEAVLGKKNKNGCSSDKNCCEESTTSSSSVTTITAEEHWESHIEKHHEQSGSLTSIVIVKFTATWCIPCKTIEPHFQSQAEKYADSKSHSFVTVDVDDVEGVASIHKIVMMPTFLVLEKTNESLTVKGRYSGSDTRKLIEFVEKNAPLDTKKEL